MNVAVVEPPGTVTEAGKLAVDGCELVRVTIVPPAGALAFQCHRAGYRGCGSADYRSSVQREGLEHRIGSLLVLAQLRERPIP